MDEEEQRGSTEIAIPKWLPTFADMMTLLMCFFVLLLTFAEMDIKRYEQIAGSMSQAFGVQRRIVAESVPMGTSVIALEFSPGVPRPTPISERYQQDDALPEPAPDAAADEATPDLELTEQMKRNVEAQIRATQADAAALAEKLTAEIARGEVEIETSGRRIVVRIRERGSFASGSAELKPEYQALMRQFRDVLAAQEGAVEVQGHTDDVPIATARFRSNWELSSARAVSVAEPLLEGGVLDPRRLSVTGFADARPLVANDSADARARNRRVEIVIDQGIDRQLREQLDALKTVDPAYYRSLRLEEAGGGRGGVVR
ncbi:MAG: OmpA family protein [Gammaproteobacteria bacterium]|jgi:chemotaxis protein MotB|nr:OmpA family protein [Gammaproteobacteria bacterium]MBK9470149.1 OmpA family protein [Gammaproteobacteria bacterium]MBP6480607.1 OmpA family protein [Pseudomonadales bacterium]